MSSTTPVLGLFLGGGGSQNKYGPPDTVDVDKLNDNFTRLDGAVGILQVPDANLPSNPYLWQTVRATTTDAIVSWNGSNWINFFPAYLQKGVMASTYYTQSQLNSGADGAAALDSRYYTQNQLSNVGVLDNRYQAKGNYLTTSSSISASQLPFKIQTGSGLASGFNYDSTRQRYYIGFPVVTSGFSTTPVIIATAVSGDAGGVIITQDSGSAAGPGGATLIVSRVNNANTTIRWVAIGT